ncbi:MAG: 4Fe-4S dicluster domain-containing protein [Acidobacteria bacterium]|nr:4Fe-4S dicluster domain-containing protein [Acidobacteriota bacterium]
MDLVQISNQKKPTGAGKHYWRSVNELDGTAKLEGWLDQEFPAGPVNDSSRRQVLKLMGASFGLAGLVACRRPEEKIMPLSKGVEDLVPGKPLLYNSVFVHAGAAAGVRVTTHDGRPTKIEGNPDHPYSEGKATGLAQGALLNLYDPDRSKQVSEKGNESSWEKFGAFAKTHFDGVGNGDGLRFLSQRVVSPTLTSVREQALKKWPGAKWVEWEPVNNDNALAGAQLAFGNVVEAHYHLDQADVIVALDSDFLNLDSPTVLPARQFTRKRKVTEPGDAIARLYAVESQFSATGATADHRLRLRAGAIAAFTADLAALVGVGESKTLSGEKERKFLAALAKDLKANEGRSVVVAGPRQPAEVHALAHAINQTLGNCGKTVTFTQALAEPMLDGLKALAADLSGGKVSTLVMLGGNPAHDAPADLDLAGGIGKAQTSIHLAHNANETSALATWHLPEAHYLESWGDARALDGTVSIQQPMILPLYGGRSALEVVAQLAGLPSAKGHDLVRGFWQGQWPAADRERVWRKALHDGVVANTKFAEAKVTAKAPAAGAKAPGTGYDVAFHPSSSLWDGRYANNAWMQETPEPMSKLVWDNAAMVSPATLKALGATQGDVISITVGGKSIEAPVMVQPGHADQAISISLGYGRKNAGRVGDGVGVNAYPIRTTAGLHIAEAQVAKTAKTHKLVTTQEHFRMEDRPIIREATTAQYKEDPKFAEKMSEMPPIDSIYGYHSYEQGYQWGMAIDLNACTGCNACLVACQAENNVPTVGKAQVSRGREMHWIRLDRYYTGTGDEAQSVSQPMTCQQCETAPCESVCPVAATTHSPEGLNDMAYNRCIGTRYCANNCPYKVRRFNFLNWHKEDEEVQSLVHNPNVTVRMRGIMEKCTYCVQRIQEKKIQAKVEGRREIKDGEIVTACQQTCPADAIVFGNIKDPGSRVAKLRHQERNYELLAELNTKPRTTYLAKLRNPNPELA